MTTLNIQACDISKIQPYELNAKIHDNAQVKRIAKSIEEFGWDQPIVVDKNYVIIKGHGRRLAAISLGLKQVPVLVRDDLSEDAVRAARLADNRVAIGDVDAEILQKELATLTFDLNGIFDSKELDFMEADLGCMISDSLIDDDELEGLVEQEAEETKNRVVEFDGREVRIDKALGFSSISGESERIVSRFMAEAKSKTGLDGRDAFLSYIESKMGE